MLSQVKLLFVVILGITVNMAGCENPDMRYDEDDLRDSSNTQINSQTATAALLTTFPGEIVEIDLGDGVAPCSEAKKQEILENAIVSKKESVGIQCSIKLPPNSYITKKIAISGESASGMTLDCNGGSIHPVYEGDAVRISSKNLSEDPERPIWSRPRNITIKNCTIHKNVRVYGMGRNGEAEAVKASSKDYDHTVNCQNAAPKGIVLDNIVIEGSNSVPLYVGPGTTYLTLKNSEIKGGSHAAGVYLDAESGHNLIIGNYIHPDTSKEESFWGIEYSDKSRELIAVDGSADNRIMNNYFSSLNHGGIFIYRNCGEGGTVRHQMPQRNQIINNVFYYDKYDGELPSVWLASRNGNRDYCGDDKNSPYGSSVNNNDLARFNVVAANQIVKLSTTKMVKNSDNPNFFFYNETVSEKISRQPGCFLDGGYDEGYDEGASNVYIKDGDFAGERAYQKSGEYFGNKYYCDNNKISSVARDIKATKHTFLCLKTSSNSGCQKQVSCPLGKKAIGIRAACNLEYPGDGASTVSAVQGLSWEDLKIVRASDSAANGTCKVASLEVERDVSIHSGEGSLDGLLVGGRSFDVSCKENDQNGGDCAIAGELLCL